MSYFKIITLFIVCTNALSALSIRNNTFVFEYFASKTESKLYSSQESIGFAFNNYETQAYVTDSSDLTTNMRVGKILTSQTVYHDKLTFNVAWTLFDYARFTHYKASIESAQANDY